MTAPAPPDRAGSWMQTFTGKAFWPLDPRAEEIDPVDIAHALGNLCRYGGHVRRFYSVAEHCVLMSRAVAPEHALAALLHDATEAYVIDLPRPLKAHLPDYRLIEGGVWLRIAERFGVDPVLPAEVHEADNRILVNERDALMATPPYDWALDGLERLDVDVVGYSPRDAEWLYRMRLRDLGVLQ